MAHDEQLRPSDPDSRISMAACRLNPTSGGNSDLGVKYRRPEGLTTEKGDCIRKIRNPGRCWKSEDDVLFKGRRYCEASIDSAYSITALYKQKIILYI